MARVLWLILFFLACRRAGAREPWEDALARMPLGAKVTQLNRTNCVDIVLHAFQPNAVVKALIFMPGATDEFYMFRRARASLTNETPTLLDAVRALTNQTLIHATFRPPLLLLHTDEDPVEPQIDIQHAPTAEKLKQVRFVPHVLSDDRDWDVLQPMLKKTLGGDIRPWRYSYDSWHFYRHSFAAWNLSGWEAVEAISLAGRTSCTIGRTGGVVFKRPRLVFQPDRRPRSTATVESFPR